MLSLPWRHLLSRVGVLMIHHHAAWWSIHRCRESETRSHHRPRAHRRHAHKELVAAGLHFIVRRQRMAVGIVAEWL